MRNTVSFMFIRLIGQSLWLCVLYIGDPIHILSICPDVPFERMR